MAELERDRKGLWFDVNYCSLKYLFLNIQTFL